MCKRFLVLLCFCVSLFTLTLTGCQSEDDVKDKNIENIKGGEEEEQNNDANKYSENVITKEEDIPEPFDYYLQDKESESLYTEVNGVIPVNGYDNYIGYVTNVFKWLPDDKEYQFNGLLYDSTDTELIAGRKLARFKDSLDDTGTELYIDITDSNIDFNEKPYIVVRTKKSKMNLIKVGEPDEENLETGYRLLICGEIKQFSSQEEYENSYSNKQ